MAVSPSFSPSVGYFDPDGIYFSPEGFDEFGGYYDSDGVYRAAEEGEDDSALQINYITSCINASQRTEFRGIVMDLSGTIKADTLERELAERKVKVSRVNLRGDSDGTQTAEIWAVGKDSARALIALHGTSFLGEDVRVDFPDVICERETVAKAAKEEQKKI